MSDGVPRPGPYPQQPGYTQQPGYPQQAGYPQPGYPQHPGWPAQPPPPSPGGSGTGVRVAVTLAVVVLLAGGALAAFLLTRDTADPVTPPVAQVVEGLAAAACTADERLPDLGGGHIPSTPEDLAASPPEEIYPDRPTASGRHVGQVVASGVYDVRIDERVTTHNLEHGYVVIWYDHDAGVDDDVRSWAAGAIADAPKIVVAPWYEPDIPGGAGVTFTAWRHRQSCETFNPAFAAAFVEAHHGINGEAPERTVAAHVAGQQGVLEPEEGVDLLLPPLD